MTTVSLLLIALASSWVFTLTSTEARRGKPAQTCDATMFGKDGFDICAMGSTSTPTSSFIKLYSNAVFTINEALHAAKCVCNQSCRPSQLVCKDGHLLTTLKLGRVVGDASVYNTWAQMLYNTGNYQIYCFCPKQVSAKKACKPVANPQKCEYPNSDHEA